MTQPPQSKIRRAAEFFSIVVLYFVTGRLGLLLAGPAGFASPMFPAAGIALAAALLCGKRSLPAIFLGAFFVNLHIKSLASGVAEMLQAAPLVAVIAGGATAQAWIGAALVRRFGGYPNELARGRDVLKFLILGGPVACVVSASAGVTSLFFAGVASERTCSAAWFNWWTGDTIGALICAPAVLLWHPQRFRGRKLAVSLPTAAAFAMAIIFVVYARKWEPWTTLASALLVTALLEALLLVLTGRTVEIEEEVARRTSDLEAQKKELEREVAERRRAQDEVRRLTQNLEEQVRQRTAQLEAANRELQDDLVERKQAEARLALLANAVESSTEMISLAGLQEQFIFVNRAFQQASGYSEREILGKKPEILFSPKNPPGLPGEILQKTRGEGWRGEVILRRKDGTEFPVFLCTSQVTDMTGRLIGLIGVAQDITARKQAETALRESEEKLRNLFEFAPMAIALHDANGNYLQTNHAYQKMLGFTNGELRDLGTRRVTHPLDVAEGRQFYNELRDGERDRYQRLKRFLAKDGRIVWAQSSASAIRDEQGRLRYIISMVEDVTARRRAEAGMHELAAIVENSDDAVVSMTVDGIVASWNKAAEAIYGYPAGEMIGRSVALLLPPGAPDEEAAILKNVVQGGKTDSYETLRRRKDGSLIEISLTVSPIRDAMGKITGASSIAHDITDRKRLERELLEISATERRRIGHELHDGLGQHLAGIAFKAKTLEEILAENSVRTEAVKDIVQLLNSAIRQCRNLARGLDPVHVEAHGLSAALENLALQSCDLFRVNCRFRCGADDLRVTSEAGLALYRIAQEAIRNAAVHGQARQIKVDLDLDDAHLVLNIHDDGKGFAPEPARKTGLGLHTMRYRANSIGGLLNIESQPDRGTKVQCIVPARLCLAPQPKVNLPAAV